MRFIRGCGLSVRVALASSVGWSCASGRGASACGVPPFQISKRRQKAGRPTYAESIGRSASNLECCIPGRPRRGILAGVLSTHVAGRWPQHAMLPIAPSGLECVSRRYGQSYALLGACVCLISIFGGKCGHSPGRATSRGEQNQHRGGSGLSIPSQ